MFTGIVQGKAIVQNIVALDNLKRFELLFPAGALDEVARGASIALNGVCLTVTSFDLDRATANFDVMIESLTLTNLDQLDVGASVNYERAAKIGAEIGGHLMSGHVSTKVKLVDRIETATNCELVFAVPSAYKKYILAKGFIGINGCSLTIGAEVQDEFSVHLIPETLQVTTFGDMAVGTEVNIEIDPQTQAIVDTVERYLSAQ